MAIGSQEQNVYDGADAHLVQLLCPFRSDTKERRHGPRQNILLTGHVVLIEEQLA
jgi:hypothetical protein